MLDRSMGSVVNIVRALEQVKQRYAKVNKDIRFIK